MDGTVIDSEPIKNAHLEQLIRANGGIIEDHELDFISGADLNTLLDAISMVLNRSGIQLDPLEMLKSDTYGRERPYLEPECKPFEGAIEFIKCLRSRGILCALVSSTPTYAVLTALNRFSMTSLFDAIMCGDMISVHKPDPEAYLTTMRILGVDPRACIVVEDSASGIAAGVAAGAYVCARDDGSGIQDLSAANERFRSFADLAF
ncbi:MAG: HAD family phosphatase [Atopobiaceae bacterium]|nr:HAD family phosphatase [Atopobiaceae bacterium]